MITPGGEKAFEGKVVDESIMHHAWITLVSWALFALSLSARFMQSYQYTLKITKYALTELI